VIVGDICSRFAFGSLMRRSSISVEILFSQSSARSEKAERAEGWLSRISTEIEGEICRRSIFHFKIDWRKLAGRASRFRNPGRRPLG